MTRRGAPEHAERRPSVRPISGPLTLGDLLDESHHRGVSVHATVEDLVLAAVRETVAEVNPTSHATVTLGSSLDRDLGLDSLVRVELLTRLEDALGVRLPNDLLVDAETPRDLVDGVSRSAAVLPARALTEVERPGRAVAELPLDVGTLVDALEWHASVHPDRVHVRLLDDDPSVPEAFLSYATLRDRARSIAAGLAASDVRPGESVAVMLPTSVEYFAVFMGVLFAGAVPVPLYPPSRPAQLDDYLRRQSGILDNAHATALVTTREAVRVARALRAPVASLRLVKTVDDLATRGWNDVCPPVRPADVALLQYTSGSTGSPKGVVLTHAHLLANIRAMARAAAADSNDVFVSWLPLYHDMGLIGAWLGSLCIGFPLVVMSPLSFLARPARWLRAISDHRATLSAGPNFGFALCARKARDEDLANVDLSSLRMLFNGAEPVSADTLERFRNRFVTYGLRPEAIAPVYGLAEAAVGLAFPPLGRRPLVDRIASESLTRSGVAEPVTGSDGALSVVACGQALPGYEMRVVDRTGNVLEDRREGRIEFRGPSATQGYFHNAQETRRLFDGDWLDTGDLGYLAAGDIYLTGRAKDLIIRAGRNLHPEALERTVSDLAGVRAGCVAVFAAPDPDAGTERLVIAAETREHDVAARDEVREAIVNVTVDILGTPPDEVVLLEPGSVPKTSSGKIRRAACREMYQHGTLERSPHPRLAIARLTLRSWTPRGRAVRRRVTAFAHGVLVWSLVLVLGALCALALLVVPRRSWRFAIVRRALRLVAPLAGVRLTVTGSEALQTSAGAVIVANHPSWIDGAVLASVLPGSPVFVVSGELAHHFWSGPFLRRLGVEFVQRATHDEGAADTRRIIAAARRGETVVIFPEGHLSRVRGLRAFRLGAFLTAVEARVPIVPIVLGGTRSLLPPGHRLPRRSAVRVGICEPVTTNQPGWAGAVELQQTVRARILADCEEPDIA
jgi:1-acyl-sn-glycerol-3-phosphate acyltransferase